MADPVSEVPRRGSLRSRGAAAISTLTLRQLSGALPPEHMLGLWTSRWLIARIMDTFGPSLAGTRVEAVDVRMADGRRVIGEWVRGTGVPAATPERAIYYVHGSGFALCSARTHRRLTAWLSRRTGLPVFSIDYRLAPEHRFPTAADDVAAGWDWLCTDGGLDPENVVMAGDSAGGHLAVDLLLQPHTAHPSGLVLLSPLIDLTFALARAREQLHRDPAIGASDAARLIELYCTTTDLTHPRLTLDVARGRPMPPTIIQAGGAEMLVADARTLHTDIRAAGGHSELEVWPDQVHVFQALPRLSPDAVAAMGRIARFISESLQHNAVREVAG